MSWVPHLFVVAEVSVEGQRSRGIAADGLPPKWFTKDPESSFVDHDLPEMLAVIKRATETASSMTGATVFDFWWQLYTDQIAWAQRSGTPRLLAGLGVSLIERAVIDACCRQWGMSFHAALERNRFGIDLPAMRPELNGRQPCDGLAAHPRTTVIARHTVGLSDPLTEHDIPMDDRLNDGLPHSLEHCVDHYGLTHFKFKLSGDPDRDEDRLIAIADVLNRRIAERWRFTLDGNEQFANLESFREAWSQLHQNKRLRHLLDHQLLFVEQPIDRNVALDDEVGDALQRWNDAPPMIIDESDGDLNALPRALKLGFRGTSHKNCKGIFKSVAAKATLIDWPGDANQLILSAEDLGNVGPVALLQDLAVVASLGIPHVERNGHHFFAGLSMFPERLQRQIVEDHSDLYRWHERGFATLQIQNGQLNIASLNNPSLGTRRIPDLADLGVPWAI